MASTDRRAPRATRLTDRFIRGRHAVHPRLRRRVTAGFSALVTGALALGSITVLSLPAAQAAGFTPTPTMTSEPAAWGPYQQATRDQLFDSAGNFWQAHDYGVEGPGGRWDKSSGAQGAESLAVDVTHHRVYSFTRRNSTTAVLDSSQPYGPGGIATDSTVQNLISGMPGSVTGMWRAVADEARNQVFVLNPGRDSVWVLNGATQTYTREISLGAGTNPSGIALDATTSKVYIAEQGSNDIAVLDATNLNAAPVHVSGVGTGPIAVSLDTTRHLAYVAASTSKTISVVDTVAGAVLRQITVPGRPMSVSVDTAHNWVYALYTDGTYSVVDLGTNDVVTTPPQQSYSGLLDSLTIVADQANGVAYYGVSNGVNNGWGAIAIINTAGYKPRLTSGAPASPSAAIGSPYVGYTPTAVGTHPSRYSGQYEYQNGLPAGAASIRYSLLSGALPNGLTLNAATGAITGTPTRGGAFNFTLRLSNMFGTNDNTFSIAVPYNPPVLSNQSFSTVTMGAAYTSPAFAVTNDAQTVAVSGGTLPPGLNVNTGAPNSAGTKQVTITGTPTTAGSYTFSLTATNPGGTDTKNYSITVAEVAPTIDQNIAPQSLMDGQNYSGWNTWFDLSNAQTGGSPATLAVTGSLPPGLSYDPSTKMISGTSTGAIGATGSFTATLANSAGSVSRQFTWTVQFAPNSTSFQNYLLVSATEGAVLSPQSLGYHGSAPLTFRPLINPADWAGLSYPLPDNSCTSPGTPFDTLPAGLSLVNGSITGTPAGGTAGGGHGSNGCYGLAYDISNTNPSTGTVYHSYIEINLRISGAPLTLPTQTLPDVTDGTAYSRQLGGFGGTAPRTYALASGSTLPSGITLSSSGALSGTTNGFTGTVNFSATVSDAAGASASQSYTFNVVPQGPTLNTTNPVDGTVGTAYAANVSLSGYATAPISYAVTAGSLPPGLALSGKNLGGTPTTAGAYQFTVTATNGGGANTHQYTLVIQPAPVSWSAVAAPGPVTVGVPYSWTPNPSGTAISGYSLAGSLLPGLTFNPTTGQISGTATAPGSSPVTVSATNARGTVSQAYGLVASVVAPTLAASATAAAAPSGSPYTYQVAVAGGSPATSWSYTGTLPSGLAFNTSTGQITGTPASNAVTRTIQVTATNSAGSSSALALTVPVTSLPIYASATTTLATATAGAVYSASLTPSGVGPFTYSVTSGSLPAGLSINASGQIVGTAPGAGNYSFTVTATNGNGSASTAVTLPVQAAPAGAGSVTAPAVAVGQPATVTPSITGTALTYTATGMPTGWSINPSTGVITGTPGAVGTTTVAVTATNQVGSVTQTIAIPAVAAPGYTGSAALGSALAGTAYSQTVPAPSGTGPFTYQVTSGALPTGLLLNPATGAISGTPTGSGSSSFSITATNAVGSATLSTSIQVNAAPSAGAASLVSGVVGSALTGTQLIAQGTGPMTWSATGLPAGVTLSPSGALSGTPTIAGSFTPSITVTSAYGSVQVPLTLSFGSVPSAPATSQPATATVGSPFTATVFPTAGTGPFTFTVSGGSLPAGLTVNASTGVITGTPTQAGVSTARITITSPFGSVTTAQTITVSAPATRPVITPVPALPVSPAAPGGVQVGSAVAVATGGAVSPVAATVGTPYRAVLTPATPGVTYTVVGQPPVGLTVSSAGILTGTPTRVGVSSFVLIGMSSSGVVTRTAVTIVVNVSGAPVFVLNAPNSATVGTAWNVGATASGLTFAVTAGAMPTGVALNGSSGALAGKPTAPGIYRYVITATGKGGSSSQAYSTIVLAKPGSVVAAASIALRLQAKAAGSPVQIAATGLLPGSSWNVVMHSTPVVVGTGSVATGGRVASTLTLPATVPFGTHRVVLTGVSATGQKLVRTAQFTVTAHGTKLGANTSDTAKPAQGGSGAGTGSGSGAGNGGNGGALAWTGADIAAPLGLLGLLAAGGALLLLAARRRRRTSR